MTSDLRTYLKQQLDLMARARVERENKLRLFDTCAGCGGEYLDWTLGCMLCCNRHWTYFKKRGKHPRGRNWYQERRAAHMDWIRLHKPRRKGGHRRSGRGRKPTVPGNITYTTPKEAAA